MTVIRLNPPARPDRDAQIEELMGELRELITLAQHTCAGEHLRDSRDYIAGRMDLVHTALSETLFPDG